MPRICRASGRISISPSKSKGSTANRGVSPSKRSSATQPLSVGVRSKEAPYRRKKPFMRWGARLSSSGRKLHHRRSGRTCGSPDWGIKHRWEKSPTQGLG